jgi:cyclopropane fatty-acyl-phospholipid synthase-like methyltransferase
LAFIQKGGFIAPGDPILDVGPGAGYWGRVLAGAGFVNVDAVEVWAPYIQEFGLQELYRRVDVADIRRYRPPYNYRLAILGDVLEHLSVEDAKRTLAWMREWGRMILVSVPWHYPQGPEHGNPYEEHVQADLSPEKMAERYPSLRVVFLGANLGVYVEGE